ncbi:MAG: ATP-dependent 6-phosphofructokinase 3 [Acidimicrobiia bacterium]|nr:MAG: ATP-dependent 6-phosphofructokinase 3 [Acidimicrobiia bacterium]
MTEIGVVTCGGDCPGLNAVIRAVVVRASAAGARIWGVRNGWRGLAEGDLVPLTRDDVRGLIGRGGTILGTSRMDPYLHGSGLETLRPAADRLDALVVVGGDGSLRTAARLATEGLPVVGVPKTIDNDVPGTDTSFGFDTAVQVVTDAIDRLTTTAEAHNRVMLVEVMGRTTGWIAAYSGIAGGAEAVLVPEVPYDLEELADSIRRRHRSGRPYSIVVVAEGVPGPDGRPVVAGEDSLGFARLGGVAHALAPRLEELTGYEVRVSVLGHLQRGGSPTAYDRVLATRMGVLAAELALEGRTGTMTALRGDEVVAVDLDVVREEPRGLPPSRYRLASWFFA